MGRKLVLGIDGGGSRSEARLWDGGRELCRAAGGPLNPNHVGVARSGELLVGLIRSLRIGESGAGGSLSVDAACVGLSGLSHPASRGIVQAAFQTAGVSVKGPMILVPDAELALEAAFGAAAPSGVTLIAGTGSIALARDASGRIRRAGGLGPERGDAGGGHWIGVEARRVLAGLARGVDAGRPADLVPEVLRRSRGGDRDAVAILERAARELAAVVRQAAGAARLGPGFEVRAAGGLAIHAPEILGWIASDLASSGASLGPVVADPILGAMRRAEREDCPPHRLP